jgi:hypothetical protein
MRTIEANDLYLFTINTGELYQYHKFLAPFPVREWRLHLTDRVIPLYGRQVEPVTYDWETIANVAQNLKDYYQEHVAESEAR